MAKRPQTTPNGDCDVGRASPKRTRRCEENVAAVGTGTEDSLTDDQRRVVRAVRAGKNVFFTGSAGTGKSYLLKYLVRILRSTHGFAGVFPTATTGVAASVLGGTTLHAFAGIGVAEKSSAELAKRVAASPGATSRWRTARVLLIDEISMLDGRLFDKLDRVARHVRGCPDRPFGGLQVVLCGDFLQLAPVTVGPDGTVLYAFEGKAWKTGVDECVVLRTNFRQQADPRYARFLEQFRRGVVTAEARAALADRSVATVDAPADGASARPPVKVDPEAVRLCALNNQVKGVNDSQLRRCAGRPARWFGHATGAGPSVEMLVRDVNVPPELELRVGCRVMLLTNIDVQRGLVNGACGVVRAFLRTDTLRAAQRQYQTAPQEPAGEDAGCSGAAGEAMQTFLQTVVAAEEFDLPGHDDEGDGCGEQTVSGGDVWLVPVVEFETLRTGRVLHAVRPHTWTNEQGDRAPASYTHLPLRLAYALSIHKSQGLTIPNLHCNLGGLFADGHAYVALSRAQTLQGLTVVHFTPDCVRANPRVVDFYDQICQEM